MAISRIRHLLGPIGTLAVLALLCGPAAAQTPAGGSQEEILARERQEKAAALAPYRVSAGEERVRGLEEARFPSNVFIKGYKGIHPVVGGMPSGSGLVGGVGYIYGLEHEPLQFQVNARFSTRGFRQFDTRLEYPPPQNTPLVRAFFAARHQNFVERRFFGLGNQSTGPRSTFGDPMQSAGGGLIVATDRRLRLTVGVDRLRSEVDGGRGSRPLETLYGRSAAPGVGTTTDYHVVGGRLHVDLTAGYTFPPKGVTATIEGWRYDDRSTDRFDFTYAAGEVTAQLPLGYNSRRVAVRLRAGQTSPDGGSQVPFNFMETLGGGDTLRGYRQYRFRDTRSLLVSAEYRWEVWTYASFAVFVDAGKVFSRADDLDFHDLHKGYGFGLRMHAPGPTYFNIDLARSREGIKLHVGGGPRF